VDEKFKMPQSSYDEVVKVVKAYGHLEEAVGLEEVSRLTSLHVTIISRNVGFLLATGVLTPGAKKGVTPLGKSLANALEHAIPDEISRLWRMTVAGTDFLTKLVAAVRIRNGMDQGTLESHIAYSAGQPKKPQFMTGARTIIEILLAANLLTEVDGKYMPTGIQPADHSRASATPSGDLIEPAEVDSNPTPRSLVQFSAARDGDVQIRVNINLTCTPKDLEKLGDQLRKMIKDIGRKATAIDDADKTE